jgi:Ricin-type beta-trefoil lectin domain
VAVGEMNAVRHVGVLSLVLLSTSLFASDSPAIPAGAVRLIAEHSGKCLEATGDPNQAVAATQRTCDATLGQEWSFKAVPGGYQIVSVVDSHLCLNLRVATAAQGARIWRSACTPSGTDGEIWRPEAAGDGYTLTAVHSGKCMNVSQASTADGTAIIQWTCVGSPNETWVTQPATSPPPLPRPASPAVPVETARPFVAPVGSPKSAIESFVAPVTGTLYLKCVGGSAGALSQFGLGTSPSTFVSYLSALPQACPTTEVAAGRVTAGQAVPFGIQTWWTGQSFWAFSTGSDPGSMVSFTDMDNSLGWGGSIIQMMGTNTWVLHLNDAAHYTLSSGEANNILVQIRLQPSEPVGPGVVGGPGEPPPPPGSTNAVSALSPVRAALQRAVSSLEHAANQSCPVQKAVADINVATNDLNGAITFLTRHPDAAGPPSFNGVPIPTSPIPSADRPNFTPPARPAPQRNVMLEGALNNLQTAFDALARSGGGDLGGFRARMNTDIANAASDLIGAINAANAAFLDGRRDLPPCSSIR